MKCAVCWDLGTGMTVSFSLRQVLTQSDGFEIHRLQEGSTVPAVPSTFQRRILSLQDMVRSLSQPNAVPRGHNVTGLHWDRAFPG